MESLVITCGLILLSISNCVVVHKYVSKRYTDASRKPGILQEQTSSLLHTKLKSKRCLEIVLT